MMMTPAVCQVPIRRTHAQVSKTTSAESLAVAARYVL